MFDLKDKVALVTGGSRGIGRAISKALAARGAYVVVNYAGNEAAARETVEAIAAAGGQAEMKQFSVADAEAVDAAITDVHKRKGRLDILVNNAGITRDMTFRKMTKADWDAVMRTNLDSCFNMTKHVMEPMTERGRADIVLQLMDHLFDRIDAIEDGIDDSDGEIGGVLARAQTIHHAACRKAKPDRVQLARQLFAREIGSEWGFFEHLYEDYADVLGKSGLAEFRRLAEEEESPQNCTDSADSGPHRICGSKRKNPDSLRQQIQAGRHRCRREDARPQPGEALTVLQANRPRGFEDACEQENEPCVHDNSAAIASAIWRP